MARLTNSGASIARPLRDTGVPSTSKDPSYRVIARPDSGSLIRDSERARPRRRRRSMPNILKLRDSGSLIRAISLGFVIPSRRDTIDIIARARAM